MTSRDFRPVEELLRSGTYSSKVKEFLFLYWMEVRQKELMEKGRFYGLPVGNGVVAKHFLMEVPNLVIRNTIQINEDDGSKTYIIRIHEPSAIGKGFLCVVNEQDMIGMEYTVDKIID